MEPDWELISQIFGPAAPMLIAFIWAGRWFYPIYKRHVRALERDIILRTYQLKVLKAHGTFLKEQGHEIEVPELINSVSGEGETSG